MGAIAFTTTLVKRGPGVAVLLDAAQVTEVGEGAKRFPVAATVNGHTWRTTVVHMRGEFLFGLSQQVRREVGVDAGQAVEVKLELDQAERLVEVPPALADALAADGEASAAYQRLAYTHRKEYARWIEEAKREDTRERRIAQALEMLRAGKTRS